MNAGTPWSFDLQRCPRPGEPDGMERMTKEELRSRVTALEVANYLAERRCLYALEEVRASRARLRFMARRMAEIRGGG